ncbi:hypothetical protein D3C71_2168260 [compost metagenome]
MLHRLANRICSTLKPTIAVNILLSRQNIYKTLTKNIKVVRIFDVRIEGSRIKLG